MLSTPGVTGDSVVATSPIASLLRSLIDWWVDLADNACYGIANEGR